MPSVAFLLKNFQAFGNSLPLSNEVKEVKAKGFDATELFF
jgi:hypothetical protein